MRKETNGWKILFWLAFIIFIILISFWVIMVIENRNSQPTGFCASAVQCDCSKDITRCECKYYSDEVDETGNYYLKGPIYCDRSGSIGGN